MSRQPDRETSSARTAVEIKVRPLVGAPRHLALEYCVHETIQHELRQLEKEGCPFPEEGLRIEVFYRPRSPENKPQSSDAESPNELPWQRIFLDQLRRGKTVKYAAQLVGVARRRVYRFRKKDEIFARRWDEAIAESLRRTP